MNEFVGMKVFHLRWDQVTRKYQIESGIIKGRRNEIPAVTVDVDGTEKTWNVYDTFPNAKAANAFITLSDELGETRRALQRISNELSAVRVLLRDMLYPQ